MIQWVYANRPLYTYRDPDYSDYLTFESVYTPAIACTTTEEYNAVLALQEYQTTSYDNIISSFENATGLHFQDAIAPGIFGSTASEEYCRRIDYGLTFFHTSITPITDYYNAISPSNMAYVYMGADEGKWIALAASAGRSSSNNVTLFGVTSDSGVPVGSMDSTDANPSYARTCAVTNNHNSESRMEFDLPVLLFNSNNMIIDCQYSIYVGFVGYKSSTGNSIRKASNYYTSSDPAQKAAALRTFNGMHYSSGPVDPENPYDPGGESQPSSGTGTFDNTSDPVLEPSLPTSPFLNTGFTKIFNPTLTELQNLANYLWTDSSIGATIINKVKQYFENAMQTIISLTAVPCPVTQGSSEEFKVLFIGTGRYMHTVANQYTKVDCGTLKLEPQYATALDYAPYTRLHLFLPFVGMVDLSTDEVMGTTLRVTYHIDVVSGACVANVISNDYVLYQFTGACNQYIPMTSADFSSYMNALLSVAKLAVSAAPVSGSTRSTSTVTPDNNLPKSTDSYSSYSSRHYISPQSIVNTVGDVIQSKPNIQRTGSFSGNSGILGVRYPYIIREYPNVANPAEYGQFNGYPSLITMELGQCNGYTKVQSVQLTEIPATSDELAEIDSLLKNGVIF